MKTDEIRLREILEEHAENPYGTKVPEVYTHSGYWKSSRTGNLCRIQIVEEQNQITHITAQVEGSALAKACASIMCSELQDEPIEHAHKVLADLEQWIEHRVQSAEWKGDLLVYQSLVQFPERIDCAMLCWYALQNALSGEASI